MQVEIEMNNEMSKGLDMKKVVMVTGALLLRIEIVVETETGIETGIGTGIGIGIETIEATMDHLHHT